MSEEQKKFAFKLKSKDGAELEFSSNLLSRSQIDNIIKDVIAPTFFNPDYYMSRPADTRLEETLFKLGYFDVPKEPTEEEKIALGINIHEDLQKKMLEEQNDRLRAEELNAKMLEDKEKGISVISQPKARKLPIVNSNHSTNSMLDLVGQDKLQKMFDVAPPEQVKPEPSDVPDFHRTGIKYNEANKPRYRLGYDCPRCGNSGRHYIPKHVPRVACHNCQSQLIVEPATENGFGVGEKYRDDNGNFFIADTLDINLNVPMYEKGE